MSIEDLLKRDDIPTDVKDIIAQDIGERARAELELTEKSREMALLNRASHVFNSSLELDTILDNVLEEVRVLMGVVGCSIWLTDDFGLVCRKATGPEQEVVTGWRLQEGQGLAGWVAKNSESLIVSDAEADERHFDGVNKQTHLGLRSILATPLLIKDKVIGVLQVVDSEVGRFSESELVFVDALAASAAIAIENARLYKELKVELVEKKEAEYALQQSEAKYRLLIEEAPLGIVYINSNGDINEVNSKVLEIFDDISIQELLSVNIFSFPPFVETGIAADVRSFFETGSPDVFERLLKRDIGRSVYMQCHMAAIYNEKNEVSGALAVVNDISEKKRAEKILFESQRKLKEANASKDRLFSIIAHDLRNPFTSILTYAELMKSDIELLPKDTVVKLTQQLYKVTQNMDILLENLLLWSKNQSGILAYEPVQCRLFVIVNKIVDLFSKNASDKNITIINEVDRVMIIFADVNMIETILRNLISNAIKFGNDGGKIVISAQELEDEFEIFVADDGVGIDPAVLEGIFEHGKHSVRLGTNKEKGTGLGLTLCRDFVAAWDGQISVESSLGSGSTFRFTVPKSGME